MYKIVTGLLASFLLLAFSADLTAAGLPLPKEGLLVRKDDAEAVRRKVAPLWETPAMTGPRGIRTVADDAVDRWPQLRREIAPYVSKLLDLEHDRNPKDVVPDDAREAAKKLAEMVHATAKLGFVYFLTGESKYAQTAHEIIVTAGRVPRWGWFNWDGVNVPQIPFGMYTRNVAFGIDFCWNDWNEAQRREAIEILAEKGVEPYWRLVSLSPFMGLHHLRSKNQGSNVLSAAVIASTVVGDSVPENRVWFDSLLQTYTWIVAHDIGWAGGNLESGLPGYWSVSMQNLYTAASCLANVREIDLRAHPAFFEATWYPIMKEATVPPHKHARFDKPYPKDQEGLSGTIQHKPIELPAPAYGGSWWYDYAARFPESPAISFIGKNFQGRIADAHQAGHSEILELLWVHTMARPESFPQPTRLFKATDREAMFRSGYGSPHTFLSFNGDMFLSARNEVLCCTGGLAWHFPWHQYAVTESVLETEDQPFSPSMTLTEAFNSELVSLIRTKNSPSNVTYYPRPGQLVSHKAYKTRTRDIAYVRSINRDQVYDYFLFVDRVDHVGEKWHSFNWHIWSSPGNEGRYEVVDDTTVLARRPNAAVLLKTLSHPQMIYEQQAIPSQPTVAYVFDHNARLLRAIAGPSQRPDTKPVVLPSRLWADGKQVQVGEQAAVLFEDLSEPEKKSQTLRASLQLQPGCRYQVRLDTQKQNARMYENFTWIMNLKLLDGNGRVLLDAAQAASPRDPHPLRLSSPASNEVSYKDWKETTTHFTAPAGVAAIEATFVPATYGHGTSLGKDSKVWLSEMTFTPLGVPKRISRDTLVTLVLPLENNASLPKIIAVHDDGKIEAEIVHPSGVQDKIRVTENGQIYVDRRDKSLHSAFGASVTELSIAGMRALKPVTAALSETRDGLRGNLVFANENTVTLAGKQKSVAAGTYLYNDGLHLDPHVESLRTNSAASQARLRAGLAGLAKRLKKERDRYTSQGWTNIALDAEVTASASRDDRFAAKNLIDNQTWESPIDGVVDYTLGTITTTGNGGYGRGPAPFDDNLSVWPLYFRPTYWLLPPRQNGTVTLKLKHPARLKMIRLLNTSNAGLNDFAAMNCRITLLDNDSKPLLSREVTFGRAWDRSFDAAFAKPKFFDSYGKAFKGILEPGVAVPFGEAWQEVRVDSEQPVRFVRIAVEKSWALGGGLNEIQVYPAGQ